MIHVYLNTDSVDNNSSLSLDIRDNDTTVLTGSVRGQNTSSATLGNSIQCTWVGPITATHYITVRAAKSTSGENWNAGNQQIYIVRLS
jgi:hypothetical protein